MPWKEVVALTVLLWILGVLLGLIVLLCLSRLGITVHFDDVFSLDMRLGVFHLHFQPGEKKEPAKQHPEKKQSKQKKEITAEDLKGKFPKVSFADVREMYRTLWPVARKALVRTRRGIRLKPFRLAIFLAGGNPADLAVWYGRVNAAVWTLMPQLEQLLTVSNPSIHTEVDFAGDKTRVRGEIGMDVRIGTLLWIALAAGLPTLRWLLRFLKTHKKPSVSVKKPTPPAASGTSTAA